jgi:hypothetical protein
MSKLLNFYPLTVSDTCSWRGPPPGARQWRSGLLQCHDAIFITWNNNRLPRITRFDEIGP